LKIKSRFLSQRLQDINYYLALPFKKVKKCKKLHLKHPRNTVSDILGLVSTKSHHKTKANTAVTATAFFLVQPEK